MLEEKVIHDDEQRLRLILESTTEGWWEWDVLADTTYHSPTWYQMLGYQADEFASSFDMWVSLMHPEDRNRAVNQQNRHMTDDNVWTIDFRMRTKSAGYKWIRSKGRVVARDGDGAPLKIVGIHLNIDELKRLESLEREREIQEELMAGIIRVSHSTFSVYDFVSKRFIYTMGKIYRTLGYTKKEFLQLCKAFIDNFLHEDDKEGFLRYVADLKAGKSAEPLEFTYRVKAKDGQYHWIWTRDAVFRRDAEGLNTQIIGSAIDITAYKELEEQIDEHTEYLQALSSKNAHELRGPVSTLQGLLNLMDLGMGSEVQEKVLGYMRLTVEKMDEVIIELNDELSGRVES